MNTQNINNSNNETNNGMSQVVIDLRPKVKHQDGHGREVLADVHFRIDVQAYTANLYTYTKEAREESEKACEAYYSEVVELLKAEGWTLRKEKFGVGDCPQMVKGTQYLYCHPQDISGEVDPADIETLEAKIKALTTCKYYNTDNYGDIIVTTSESDEKQLYRDTYADGLASIWQECTTTKRSNLYKDKAEAEHCVRRRICIANRRADLNDIGTGSYNMRTPLLQFLMEEYDRLLQAGYIKEATGQNGRTLCRWINKKEEKELNKARREAEKAEKVRETYKTGLLVTDKQYGHDYERITGIEEGMNTYVVTTATKIQLECMNHYRVMEKAKNEHTIKDLPEWVRPGAVLMINGTWKWEEVVIVELADGCVWYKKGNSVLGWTYDHFISLYVNHHKANVKEYAPEPTLETIGKIRAAYEADGCTYPGDIEGTREYYRDALLQAADGATVCYQFGNCRFDCKRNESGTWDVHAYDTNGEDTTFEGRTASFFGGMFNDLFKTWGSGNLPDPDGEPTLEPASEISDPEGRKFQDFTTWNGKTVKAEERQKWTKFFAEGISNKVNFGGNGSTYKHNAGKIRVSIAYRNGSKKAEDMSYCVGWYEETDKGTKLRESENGVSIWQAARAMADFHLLADVVGFTSIDEILNPTEKPSLETSSEITDGAKKESFGKMFIYRLYIKWKWMQQRFERIGDMDRAADCFYHRLRLTKLYICQPGWRIMDYGDMKPIFFPRQRIK